MNIEWLTGTGVAVVTPFYETGEIDYPALRAIIQHLIAGKVEYLVALGTTGETSTLGLKEQEAVFDCFMEEAGGKLPIVLGIGGNDTRVICQKVEHYSQQYQPAGFLSVSPYYNKPTQAGILAHYRAVSGATTLPVILYNVPGRTGSNLTVQTSLELAHTCANIVAIKEASGDMSQIMQLIHGAPEGFWVISGDDSMTLPMLALGAKGVISVSANAVPFLFAEMVRAALAEDMEKARSLHYQLLPLMELHFTEGNPAGVKASLAHLGLGQAHVRLPLVQASHHLFGQISAEIEGILNKKGWS